MKKLHLLSTTCFPFLIFCYVGFGQTPVWTAKYDNANARAMAVDAAGNTYVTGPADGGKKNGLDFLTVKYSPGGSLIWSARYNGPNSGEDWPYAIAVDGSGNVAITGRSLVSSSGKGPNYDYATVKYSPSGELVWSARYGSAGNRCDIPQDVKVDDDGYVYVTGFADAPSIGGGGNSIVTIKYTPVLGTESWKKVYDILPNIYDGPNPNAEQAFSLALDDASGNVYVAGTVLIKYTNSGTFSLINSSSDDRREVLVDASGNILTTGFSGKTTKFDASGNLLWQATNAAGFWDMALDAEGNVYVTGSGNSTYETLKYDGN